jgi:hypothetical protein
VCAHSLEPVFPAVDYAFTCVPTYPTGQIGFVLCCKENLNGEVVDVRSPARTPSARMQDELTYYSPAVHAAAFVLPAFAERVVGPCRRPSTTPGRSSSTRAGAGFSRSSLAVAAVAGVLVGAAAAAALGVARRR